ncbi:polysaccharide biosynthesis protein [Kineococcus radiotolerans SRS30216 = ATCC BAA-149]|uniref:Polysaccharide biosynthesis protein n=2 Tax=Kineococcus radiotolerans TaxID=131568 RepID=A6WEA4_KINRD|nr:polysaccharide biosynthesis protein [Kineococcus radiotolerans SRS30216 = ATCC BAA-149]
MSSSGPDRPHTDQSRPGGGLRARSAVGVMWTAGQIWASRALSAAAFVVVGRQLEPSAFGLVALATGIIAVLTIISDSGLATYVIRRPVVDERTRSTAFWTSLGLSIALAGALAACAPLLADAYDQPELVPVLLWLSLNLLLAGANSLPNALMRRELRFKALAARATAATLVGSVTAIVAALAGAGVWSLVAQVLVGSLTNTVMLWCAVSWRPHLSFDRRQAREMLAFGSKLLGIDLLMQARDRGEEFVLAGIASATVLGYWTVGTRLVKLVQDTGSSVISSVATPTFSKIQDDLPRMSRAYETAMAASGALIFPAMLFLAATSTDLVPWLLGEQWAVTGSIAQVTAVTAAIGVFSYFDRTVFVAVGKLRPELLLVLGIVVSHLAVVVLAASHGLFALAVALLVRQAATFPVRQIVLHRAVGIPYRCLLRSARVLLAAVVMAGIVLAVLHLLTTDVRWVRVAVSAGVAGVVYPGLLLLFARPVAREFTVDVRNIVSRRRARSTAGSDQEVPASPVP